MTKEKALMLAPVLQAFGEGKTIQYRLGSSKKPNVKEWTDVVAILACAEYLVDDTEFRIKPTPTYRPWTPEEVPVGALIRTKEANLRHIIIAFDNDYKTGYAGRAFTFSPIFAFENCEHSLDHGKTWQPCGTLVNE